MPEVSCGVKMKTALQRFSLRTISLFKHHPEPLEKFPFRRSHPCGIQDLLEKVKVRRHRIVQFPSFLPSGHLKLRGKICIRGLPDETEVARTDVEPKGSFRKETGEEQGSVSDALEQDISLLTKLFRRMKKLQCEDSVNDLPIAHVLYKAIDKETVEMVLECDTRLFFSCADQRVKDRNLARDIRICFC